MVRVSGKAARQQVLDVLAGNVFDAHELAEHTKLSRVQLSVALSDLRHFGQVQTCGFRGMSSLWCSL